MKYLIGNLKMNFTLNNYKCYLNKLNKLSKKSENKVAVIVPYPYLSVCKKYFKNFGAQNCHYEDKGAFTGEVSVSMLKDFNCKYCIIGHSERRAYYNETDQEVNKKVKALLNGGITPILCFGETLSEKESQKTKKVIKKQLTLALKDVADASKIIFAYEPVWAIGTGLTPTITDIKKIAKYIKEQINKISNVKIEDIILLYGGSMNNKNAAQITQIPNIDGGLIGGACLDINKFEEIIKSC